MPKQDVEKFIEKWAKLFPVELAGTTLTCWDGAIWVPQLGLIAALSLVDAKTYQGPSADLVIVGPSDVDQFDACLKKVKEAIKALKDKKALKKALAAPLSETLGLSEVVLNMKTFKPTKEEIERRETALKDSFALFPAVEKRMKEAYGLRLPRHIAVWAAFSQSLSVLESRGLRHIGRRMSGIMLWFEEEGLARKTRDKLDARLESRFRCDPPELVTVMHGDSDGLHYGLWYDDPAELPSFIAHNYARDSAETSADQATVLRELTRQVKDRIQWPDYPEEPVPMSVHVLAAALRWFKDADEKALADDGPRRWAGVKRGDILGGLGPALTPKDGKQRATYKEHEERSAAYRDKKQAKKVKAWIAEAKEELNKGKPAFALVLGRELHWLDSDDYRADSLELLCASYDALGRKKLSEIAQVHHANRDLQSVSVFADDE